MSVTYVGRNFLWISIWKLIWESIQEKSLSSALLKAAINDSTRSPICMLICSLITYKIQAKTSTISTVQIPFSQLVRTWSSSSKKQNFQVKSKNKVNLRRLSMKFQGCLRGMMGGYLILRGKITMGCRKKKIYSSSMKMRVERSLISGII